MRGDPDQGLEYVIFAFVCIFDKRRTSRGVEVAVMMVEEILLFKNFFFQYPGVPAEVLSNCSFFIKKGERVVIKGESGSGKTTLLRLLLGSEKPDKGEILLRGEPLDTPSIKQLRRETIWLPQDLNLGNGTLQDVFYYHFELVANSAQKPDEDTIFQVLKSLGLKE